MLSKRVVTLGEGKLHPELKDLLEDSKIVSGKAARDANDEQQSTIFCSILYRDQRNHKPVFKNSARLPPKALSLKPAPDPP